MNDDIPQNSDDIEAWQLDMQLDAALDEERYELAVPLAERLLEIQDAKFGPTHEKTMETLACLINGWMHLEQWERAMTFLERRFGAKHPRLAPVLIGWAATSFLKGDFDAAEEHALRALGISREMIGPDDTLVATCHSILADLGRRRKDWDNALMHAVEAFRIRASNVSKLTQEPLLIYKDLMLVGDIFFEVGEYEEACKSARMAVQVTVGALDSEPLRMASALSLYGRAAMADKKPEGAVNPFKHALEFYEKLYGENDERLSSPLVSLGQAYQAAEYYDEAEETFQRLYRLYQVCHADSKSTQAVPLVCLGDLAHQRKDHAQAATFYEEALTLAIAEFGEDSFRLYVLLDKAAEAHLAAENLARAEELSRWHIRLLLPALPSKDEPPLLPPVRRLADIEIRRLKEKKANEEELKNILEWVARIMQVTTERLEAETAELKAQQGRPPVS